MKDKIFKAHPNLESYHETSDGTAFFIAGDAKNHAKSLDDKNVTEVKNPNLIEVVETKVEETDEEFEISAAERLTKLLASATEGMVSKGTTYPIAPATDAPATDAPATDVPATDAPATDVPATDAPATDVPATDVPATDAPATVAPATVAPKTAPKAKAPRTTKPNKAK